MLATPIALATLSILIVALMTNLYVLWRMIQITAEAKIARAIAVATSERAEKASLLAASLAKDSAHAVSATAANIQELTLNTNSIKDALIASTAKASDLEGEKRGIAIGVAQEVAKTKT